MNPSNIVLQNTEEAADGTGKLKFLCQFIDLFNHSGTAVIASTIAASPIFARIQYRLLLLLSLVLPHITPVQLGRIRHAGLLHLSEEFARQLSLDLQQGVMLK